MTLLAAALLMLAALAALAWLPGPSPRGAAEPVDFARWALVAVVVLLPLLYAALVLHQSRARLETLRFTYAGKQLAYGPGVPLTAGGSAAGSEHREDLHAPLLGPRTLRLEPADASTAETLEGVDAGDPVLRLASPSPVVRVDELVVNSHPLADGDRILLVAGAEPIELVFRGGELARGERVYSLPGTLERALRGPGRVFYLPDLLARLAPDEPAGQTYRSLLHRPRARDPWRLLIREEGVRVVRDEEVAASFVDAVAVPADFELRLDVVWGRAERRILRTVRRDRLQVGAERVEVRFGEPQRRLLRLDEQEGPAELGVVVPSTVDRREQLLELEEDSPRFRGLAASLRYDPEDREAALAYLGDRLPVEYGDLYALGEGADQMLVRIERTAVPRHLLLDLALLALFVAVFLGRGLARDAALAAIVGPAGLLLANRLLFSYRAASNPPDFYAEGYGEARLALWLVPAAIVFGRSLAWLVRRPVAGSASAHGGGLGPLRWPLLGIAVAGLGCLVLNRGVGNLPWLALVPWLAAALLASVHVLSGRPWLADRLRRWQTGGWPWRYRWLLLCGALILGVRWTASLTGMQETLRLPAIQFRVLWTVLQLPLCAAVFALTLHLVDERRRRIRPAACWRAAVRDWLGGICVLVLFIVLAFLAVAAVVGDTGLLIVHALPPVLGLLLLAAWPRTLRGAGRRLSIAYGAGLVLACVPLLLVLAGNVAPERMAQALDGWETGVEESAAEGADGASRVVDQAARLSATRAQQLFRLYMLANPDILSEVGLQPSERVAIHYHTLQSYAEHAGFRGAGFASTRLPRHLGATYLSDLVPMVFVLAELGVAGMLALALVYLGILGTVVFRVARDRRSDRLGSQGTWIAVMALLAFVLPSLYMILANLNLVLFTGKNCSLLALNSVSDVLESAALLGLGALGLALRRNS